MQDFMVSPLMLSQANKINVAANPDMGGYCDYMLFTPAMFPLIPPCKTLKCDLNIAFAPNNSKERMIMSVVRNYYGLNPFGYASERDMVDNLTSSNNNNGVYDRSGIT